ALIAVAIHSSAHAFSAGVSGMSGKPPATSCDGCHSAGGTMAPMVTLKQVGASMLDPGATGTFELDVVSSASTLGAGWDIAAGDGTLAVKAGMPEAQLKDGEISHTSNW